MTEQDYLEIIYDQTRMIEDLNQMVSKLVGELEQLKGVWVGHVECKSQPTSTK